MGAHKPGDGRKHASKGKAPCRADTRGGSWAGIPKCLIDSPAYRDLSLHARAILVELTARMTGYNNGEVTAPQRELVASLRCSAAMVHKAMRELMEHGIIEVSTDAKWKDNRAREYRLTFVSTKAAGATNDYLRWTPQPAKIIGNAAVSVRGKTDTPAVSVARKFDTAAVSRIAASRGKPSATADTPAVSHICKPCPPAQPEQRKGGHGSIEEPLNPPADRSADETGVCERCATAFDPGPHGRTRRFCSETCRKQAEAARAYQRRKEREGGVDRQPQSVWDALNGRPMPVTSRRVDHATMYALLGPRGGR